MGRVWLAGVLLLAGIGLATSVADPGSREGRVLLIGVLGFVAIAVQGALLILPVEEEHPGRPQG